MGSVKMRFLGTAVGSAMYARFVVPHYHSFVRINGGREQKIELPDCELDGEFVADPFLFAWDGDIWLFFEGMRKGRGDRGIAKGVIGCLRKEGMSWRYMGVALEEPYHLSYPQIFEDGGSVYMIPETAQAGEVALYEAVDFPLKWRKTSILMCGRYVDSSLFCCDGFYYIVATPEDPRFRPELWCARALAGPWKRHPSSDNVSSSLSLRRNGGAIYKDGGRTYRVVQDCDGDYGVRLFRMPIETVSPTSYSEGAAEVLAAAISWPQPKKHHTYNRIKTGDSLFEVVDRHYNTIRKPSQFLVAAVWYLIDGMRYVYRSVFKGHASKKGVIG